MRVGNEDVLQLGAPGLRIVSTPVGDVTDAAFQNERDRLHAALVSFRAEHGFGRAIAAPQIGVPKRFVAANLGDGPFTLIDPEIEWKSDETFTLWDDCMSFPELLVRVRRHRRIRLRYVDDEGAVRTWEVDDPATSELFQHELDHLDGVLAIDRALDRESIVKRDVFEGDPERFASLADGAGTMADRQESTS